MKTRVKLWGLCLGILLTSLSAVNSHYDVPVGFPQKSVFKITAQEVSATMDVSAGFELLLVRNSQ